jgi:hypothetical protein
MTGWDVLSNIINDFPPVALALLLVAAVVAAVVFVIGFARHGVNFIKYGFKQKEVGDLAQKIDALRAEFKNDLEVIMDDLRTEFKNDLGVIIDDLRTEFKDDLEVIKVNHFGHLKEFLTELTSILLDKDIINNQDKARLDNKLRGM